MATKAEIEMASSTAAEWIAEARKEHEKFTNRDGVEWCDFCADFGGADVPPPSGHWPCDGIRALDALEDVLERHKPTNDDGPFHDCAECHAQPHPCATRRGIEAKLGGEKDG